MKEQRTNNKVIKVMKCDQSDEMVIGDNEMLIEDADQSNRKKKKNDQSYSSDTLTTCR